MYFVSAAALNAKYDEGELLGEGGFGSVFAGHRKADNLPVGFTHTHTHTHAHTKLIYDSCTDSVIS